MIEGAGRRSVARLYILTHATQRESTGPDPLLANFLLSCYIAPVTDREHQEWLKDESARKKAALRHVHKPAQPASDDDRDKRGEKTLSDLKKEYIDENFDEE